MARRDARILRLVAPPESTLPPEVLDHYEAPTIAAVFDAIEQDLGGREALLSTLLGAPNTPDTDRLVGLLADPRSDTMRLGQLLRQSGLTLAHLIDTMKQAGFARALVRSINTIADRAPAVVHDVMTRAAAHEIRCTHCEGLTTVAGETPDAAPVVCPTCKGRGVTLVLPDLDRQKVALDLARLLPKKALVEQNFDQRKQMGSGSIGAMTALIRATDDLLAHAQPAPRAPTITPPVDGDVIGGAVIGEVVVVEDPAVDSPPVPLSHPEESAS